MNGKAWREGYAPPGGAFDEMLDEAGRLRPAWHGLLASFDALSQDDVARRRRQAELLLRQNGVVLNVHGAEAGGERAWPIDLVPLVVAEDEWSRIEAGVAQRATLLDRLLADLYGERRLIRDGLIPAPLVLRNPRLLEACRHVPVAGDRRLVLYAADLIRGADGNWRVVADRAQAPSGSGYALENRIALSRSLPEAVRDNHVRRLAPYFAQMREMLWRLAPWSDNPRVVMLTPGPRNETYFEHAYLARYLGFTLVEGGDLIARDGRVWLKTLGGLDPVDVVLRRLDDDYADPLELRIESTIGVPGLLEAQRAGRLAIANALGAGAIEMPALGPYLPGIAKTLLGTSLDLPSVDGYWLGAEGALARLEADASHMTVVAARSVSGETQYDFGRLDPAARAAALSRIRGRAGDFAAIAEIVPSTMPVVSDGRFRPRPSTLRVFAAAKPGGGYQVMPGGLLRVADADRPLDLAMQRGAVSKDCWVLASGPVDPFTLLSSVDGTLEIREASSDLPSRVADNLFWLGRYAERAEGAIRALRSALMRLADGASPADLAPLGRYLWRQALVENPGTASLALFEKSLILAICEAGRSSGLVADLDRLERVTRLIEDRLSPDMTRILHQLRRLSSEAVAHPDMLVAEALGGLDRLVTTMAAFNGLEMENMTRGQGWRFLDLGRRIERALIGGAIIEETLAQADGAGLAALDVVLELADSAMTYRSRYFAAPQFAPALHLLLLDESNPRSVAYQIAAVSRHVEALPKHQASGRPTAERGLAQQALKLLKDADLVPLGRPGPDGQRPELRRLLGEIEGLLRGVSDAVGAHFFGHGFALRSFVFLGREERS